MSDKRLTRLYAEQQLIQYQEGTGPWLFWRGVCLGMENSPHVTEEWAEVVLRQGHTNK